MIQLQKIHKGYKKKVLLDDFSYVFEDVGFYGLIGKSGSGKSTLLQILAGFIQPDSGEVYFDNIAYSSLNTTKLAQLRKKYISYIHQSTTLNEENTVHENIQLLSSILSLEISEEKEDDLLQLVLLKDKKNRKIATLSGGEKQRIACVIAFLKDSKVILADEITNNLDPVSSEIIFQALKTFSQEKLVILVSHDHQLMFQYCQHIIDYKQLGNYKVEQAKRISPETLSLKEDKPQLHLKNYLEKIKRKQQIFVSIFLCIFTLLGSLGLSMFFWDATSFYATYLEKSKVNYVYSEQKIDEIPSFLFYPDLELPSYHTSKFNIDEKYKNSTEELIFVLPDYFDDSLFSNVVIDDSLKDNEIIISDYIAIHLTHLQLLPAHYDKTQHYVIDFYSSSRFIPLTIRDIYPTDCLKYVRKMDEVFKEKKQYDYTTVMMNKQTFYDTYLPYGENITITYQMLPFTFSYLHQLKDKEVIGTKNVSVDEVIITTGALESILNKQIEDVTPYLQTEIQIPILKKKMQIVGIIQEENRMFYLHETTFEKLHQQHFQNENKPLYAYSFLHNSHQKNIAFLKKAQESKIILFGSVARAGKNVVMNIQKIHANALFLTIFLLVSMLILVIYQYQFIKSNQKLYQFLFQNGISKRQIYQKNVQEFLKVYGLAIIIPIAFNYPFLFLFNLFLSVFSSYLTYLPMISYLNFFNLHFVGLLLPSCLLFFFILLMNYFFLEKTIFKKK